MARRQLCRFVALLASAIAGCAPGLSGDPDPVATDIPALTTTTASVTSSTTATTSSTTTTTTTTIPTTTTAPATTTPTELADIGATVGIPNGDGPFPAVVLVHGGSWVAGDSTLMQPLANHLTDAGYLTVNVTYSLSTFDVPGFPPAVEDVACAVRYAARHTDSDGTVAVVGHSAGAHIGAVVALTGDRHTDRCAIEGAGVPDRFVGLAGPYDVGRLGLPLAIFFGGTADQRPEAWEAGNPQRLTDMNPNLEALILYGERDGFVPDTFALDFHDALVGSGAAAEVEMVPGARHNDLPNPAVVGDLITAWLDP